MAVTAEGARLTEAHRAAQGRLSAATLRDVVAVWRLLDPAALDRSFPTYARTAAALIAARRSESASLSAAYLRAFRHAEGVTAPLSVALAEALASEAAMTSLLVTGPVAVKVAVRAGQPVERATATALTQAAGAVLRHVQNGGRETIDRTVERDERALGYARVTDGRPCAFCAMVASRGAVYKSETTAQYRDDGRKYHDKCGCGVEPVYARDGYALPGAAAKWADLWSEATAGHSGDAAIAAFRAAYKAQR